MVEEQQPPLQIHIAPEEPIELGELNNSLAALARQYRQYAVGEGYATSARTARLLVSSVSPGSIDIGLLPAIIENLTPEQIKAGAGVAVGGTVLALTKGRQVVDAATGFAKSLAQLLSIFKRDGSKSEAEQPPRALTVADCNDAIAIAGPIRNHGGSQTINVYNGDVYTPVIHIDSADAERIVEQANEMKARLKFPEQEVHQRVPLSWEVLPRGEPRTDGDRSPDKGIIEEIDPKPKPVFFADEYADLKDKILGEHTENPYTRLYFVDVEVSRVKGSVVSYRVTGYHGQTDIESD